MGYSRLFKGFNKILLNVFKYNKPVFSLYKSLKYRIRDEEAVKNF